MNKVYIITAGTYSAYHIVAIFTSKDEADAFAEEYNRKCGNRYDADCRVEEYPVGMDISLAGCRIYQARMYDDNTCYVWDTCENIAEYADRLNVVIEPYKEEIERKILECFIAVDMNCDEPEEYAQKVAADLFAEYRARQEGIT